MSFKYRDELIATANAIATPGKGILAADESTGTIGKRFEKIKLENIENNRRAYRELLFTSPGWGNYCSGVILYEETLNQKASDGTPFVEMIKKNGVIPGIKVDKGLVNIFGTNEDTTIGLDGLEKRVQEYYAKGARFAKWRAALKIGQGMPSDLSIQQNAQGLARYAIICQENGLVPIVEPEVLMDGEHTMEQCAVASEKVFSEVIRALHQHHVLLEGSLLKPNMITPGHSHASYKTTKPEEVAKETVRVLQHTVPVAIPGIMFLSGGQSEEEASLNLSAINALPTKKPWSLSFSYGRALQNSCINAWKGETQNVQTAQTAFLARAKANSEAGLGKYHPGSGGDAAKKELFEKDYKY